MHDFDGDGAYNLDGEKVIRVIATPGHTLDSVSLVVDATKVSTSGGIVSTLAGPFFTFFLKCLAYFQSRRESLLLPETHLRGKKILRMPLCGGMLPVQKIQISRHGISFAGKINEHRTNFSTIPKISFINLKPFCS